MQKLLIVLVLGLLAVGCLTPEQKQKRLRDSVLGEYEFKDKNGITFKDVFLDNGVCELWENGHKIRQPEWSISNGELHVNHGHILVVWRINADKSITWIASIINGKREPKGLQDTWKKTK